MNWQGPDTEKFKLIEIGLWRVYEDSLVLNLYKGVQIKNDIKYGIVGSPRPQYGIGMSSLAINAESRSYHVTSTVTLRVRGILYGDKPLAEAKGISADLL